jgi:hypothetical protein
LSLYEVAYTYEVIAIITIPDTAKFLLLFKTTFVNNNGGIGREDETGWSEAHMLRS